MKKTMDANWCGIENPILVEGKRYFWKGISDGYMSNYHWGYTPCKISKIKDDKVYIFDYFDNREYEYGKSGFETNQIKFKKMFSFPDFSKW